jgi:chromosome segregation ATPase
MKPINTRGVCVSKKELLCLVRKKAKRFQQSRDSLKIKNSEKATTIKKLRDRLAEIETSRAHWREQSNQVAEKCEEQKAALDRLNADNEALKQECHQLHQAIEVFKKKKMTHPGC